jgi:uncharacterized membrane protein YgaE (UPF0421/DUF939 family)
MGMTTRTNKEKWYKHYIASTISAIIAGVVVAIIVMFFKISPLENEIQVQNTTIQNLENNVTILNTIIQPQNDQEKNQEPRGLQISTPTETNCTTNRKTEKIIITAEGRGEDMFNEITARDLAHTRAMNNLLSKFPREKEMYVRHYAKAEKDTVVRTSRGIRQAHVILSVNESDIIK